MHTGRVEQCRETCDLAGLQSRPSLLPSFLDCVVRWHFEESGTGLHAEDMNQAVYGGAARVPPAFLDSLILL